MDIFTGLKLARVPLSLLADATWQQLHTLGLSAPESLIGIILWNDKR